MKTYILLLRGINVSGQKKIIMTDLKQLLDQLNFENVQTYIQSGNVVLNASEENSRLLENKVSAAIIKKYGFEVPVLMIKTSDFNEIVQKSPFEDYDEMGKKNAYFVLLQKRPEADLVKSLVEEKYPNEQFMITDNCIYLTCQKGYGNAKCNNNFFERKLKVQATTRNYKTMIKLAQMAKES